MAMKPLGTRLKGVIVPMVTPMNERGDLHEQGVRDLVGWLSEQGVTGIYPASGCGEVWKLSAAERNKLLDIAIEVAGADVLVLPGTGAGSTREAVALTQAAAQKKADGVVVWPPYHMGDAYTEDAIFDHYLTIVTAAEIPVIIYDSPEITGYPLSIELVARLAELDNIVGIKDSTGNLANFAQLLRLLGDRIAILQGWDNLLLGSLAMGSPGAVLSAANVCPRLLVDLVDDFQRGNVTAAREKHGQLLTFIASGPWQTDQFQAMKELLGMLGLSCGAIRKPWFSLPFSADQKQELADSLKILGLLK